MFSFVHLVISIFFILFAINVSNSQDIGETACSGDFSSEQKILQSSAACAVCDLYTAQCEVCVETVQCAACTLHSVQCAMS